MLFNPNYNGLTENISHQHFERILKKCFFGSTFIVMSVAVARLHYIVLHAVKRLTFFSKSLFSKQ